jgi:hypothetical protein
MSVAESGNTIRRIAVAPHMAIVIPQTDSAGHREVIHCRTGSEQRNEILAGRVAIWAAPIAIVVVSVTEAGLAIEEV